MATIRKRVTKDGSASYHVQVRLKGFPPETASFDRHADAKAWGQKIESEMRAGRHFGVSKRHTFNDLADEYEPYAKDKIRLKYWRKVFGADTLNTITPARISKQKDKLLDEETTRYAIPATGDVELDTRRPKAKRKGSTVNRYLASLSACFGYGVKTLQWIERNPCERIEKPAESLGRVRFLSDDERNALLAACESHPDLYLAVVLALSTGARQSEVMRLRYGQIDFERKLITLHQTKNGERRSLPLVGSAFTLLQARAKVRDIVDDRVFPPTGRAVKAVCLDLRQPWEKALKKAGIHDFRWHDLRHTAASYLVMSEVSLVEVAKILGHRTLQMVLRYAHLSSSHIVATGKKLADRLEI